MYNLINQIEASPAIRDFQILEFVDDESIQFLVVKAQLIDNTILHIREAITDQDRYSYHWQTKTGKLIMRWDNAPHHPHIKTHPHHKHVKTPSQVEASGETDLTSVLKIIENQIK